MTFGRLMPQNRIVSIDEPALSPLVQVVRRMETTPLTECELKYGK
jgi:regulator of extracellular matrix RemA (YlzA/DUF370 family)